MKNKEQFEFEYELDGHEFVELNILLKTLGVVHSSSEADTRITKGKVTVNDDIVTLKRYKVRSGFTVVCNDKVIIVKWCLLNGKKIKPCKTEVCKVFTEGQLHNRHHSNLKSINLAFFGFIIFENHYLKTFFRDSEIRIFVVCYQCAFSRCRAFDTAIDRTQKG
jgi:ribosome-associated protein